MKQGSGIGFRGDTSWTGLRSPRGQRRRGPGALALLALLLPGWGCSAEGERPSPTQTDGWMTVQPGTQVVLTGSQESLASAQVTYTVSNGSEAKSNSFTVTTVPW